MPQARRAQHDQLIIDHLRNSPQCLGAARVGAYWAFDGEPRLQPLLADWHDAGCEIALPVVPAEPHAGMMFRRWNPAQTMQQNKLGIHEPGAQPETPLALLDLLLMPLVAWDRQGRRLGMGAGYYDRALAPFRAHGGPLRVGIAYQCQQARQLPEDKWDVRLHAVVTEQGWFTCPA